MGYYVKAPLVITRSESGSDMYLYQGVPVPSHVSADELDRLKADDLIASDDAPDGPKKAASK